MTDSTQQFWKDNSLDEMTDAQWESLCDGCGKCCLGKLIDDETEELHYTNVVCDLLDSKKCSCSDYVHRFERVPDCVKVSLENRESFSWLPPTCAYRRLDEGRDLPEWHPLLTGNKSAMHKAGQSVRGKVIHESLAGDLEDHIALWPLIDCE
ncbi:YcgN family cysteine cluster protein [Echinimonas agarilytica]